MTNPLESSEISADCFSSVTLESFGHESEKAFDLHSPLVSAKVRSIEDRALHGFHLPVLQLHVPSNTVYEGLTDCPGARKNSSTTGKVAKPTTETLPSSMTTAMKKVSQGWKDLMSFGDKSVKALQTQTGRIIDKTVEQVHEAWDFIPPLEVEKEVIRLASHLPGNDKDDARYEKAQPGIKMTFPRDEAAHEKFKSEWWYYVGHLKDEQNHEYGYELTFFRHKLFGKDFYSAHLALSDVNGQNFQWKERSSVLHPFSAGADSNKYLVWNGDWKALQQADGSHRITAATKDFSIQLNLDAKKSGPVLHGDSGFSKKANGDGKASYYYSRPNMITDGIIIDHGKAHNVRGASWMDHEIGSNMMGENTVGWNWYSIQLEDESQLMLYMFRNSKGEIDSNSFGTVIGADGKTRHLDSSQFVMKSTGAWRSPVTNVDYPMGWRIAIPSEELELDIQPAIRNQELNTERSAGLSYWEGKCNVTGSSHGKSVRGNSYVELTGYKQRLSQFPNALKP